MNNYLLVKIALILLSNFFVCVCNASEHTYTVQGHSMFPALSPGDRVTVVSVEDHTKVSIGDLVTVQFRTQNHPVVKRVKAVPGDQLKLNGNTLLFADGEELTIKPAQWRIPILQLKNNNWRLPADEFLLLGDNPKNSLDSRTFGLVSSSQVKGKVINVIKKNGSEL